MIQTVFLHRAEVRWVEGRWVARCSCGWEGEARISAEVAVEDRDAHEEEAKLVAR